MRTSEKLQRSLDRIIDGMEQNHGRLEDNISYAKCLAMQAEFPSIVQGSHLHFKATTVLVNKKQNRTPFVHFFNSTTRSITID